MQVIYLYRNEYPFRRGRAGEIAFMEYRINLTSSNHSLEVQERIKTIRSLTCQNMIRLLKVLSEQETIHLMYEYVNNSLESMLEEIENKDELNMVFEGIQCCISCLIRAKIKAQLFLFNIGVDEHQRIKIFLPPEIEVGVPKEELRDFYLVQKTRLNLEIEEVFHKLNKSYHLSHKEAEPNFPNFIINGNALEFIQQIKKKPPHYFERTKPASNSSEDSSFNKKGGGVFQSSTGSHYIDAPTDHRNTSETLRQKDQSSNSHEDKPQSYMLPLHLKVDEKESQTKSLQINNLGPQPKIQRQDRKMEPIVIKLKASSVKDQDSSLSSHKSNEASEGRGSEKSTHTVTKSKCIMKITLKDEGDKHEGYEVKFQHLPSTEVHYYPEQDAVYQQEDYKKGSANEILEKIQCAKERAEAVLKEYTKLKKK